jgi:hypothetical protein
MKKAIMQGGSKDGKVYDLDAANFFDEIMKRHDPERYYEEKYNPKPLSHNMVQEEYKPTGQYLGDCEIYEFVKKTIGQKQPVTLQ